MSHPLFPPIRTLEDVKAVEARPYHEFMPWHGIHEALSASASRRPDARAITLLSDDLDSELVAWTYADLLDKVERAAQLFKRLAGDEAPRVAMLLPAIPEGYAVLWGGALAGTVCPINYLLRPEHIHELVNAAGCNIVVALGEDPRLAISESIAGLRAHCPGVRQVLWVGDVPVGDQGLSFESEMARALPGAPRAREGDDIAALFHTGGTTGSPKLAQHTHRNQLHSAAGAARMYALSEQDTLVNAMPLFHVAGTIVFGLSTILAGGHIVLPSMLGLRNPALLPRYWSMVERLKASLLTATPTGIATLMGAPRTPANVAHVRHLLTGGAPLPPALANQFEATTGIAVRNTFGMTECAGVVSIEPALAPRHAVSCGVRIPFIEVDIASGKGQSASLEAIGILRLRGPNVSPGYTEQERNRGTFEDGWLVSGDLACVRDGRIHVTGRSKDVIIRNAHNIDPQLIEEALMKHPGVQVAAAVGQPDEYAGELPVAYVVAKPGVQLDLEDLLAFAAGHIAERPAQPKRVDVLDALPQTAVGKVYKPALRLLALERVLRERLTAAGLEGEVQFRCFDEAQGLRAEFSPCPNTPFNLSTAERLKTMMLRFSVSWGMSPLSLAD
jgi:fatty-acyl-CoA synthase